MQVEKNAREVERERELAGQFARRRAGGCFGETEKTDGQTD